MKLNKSVICLLICVLVLVQVECIKSLDKKTKSKSKSKSKVFQRVFDEWNTATIKIEGVGGEYNIEADVKTSINSVTKEPLGLVFMKYRQLTDHTDTTGYITFGQELLSIKGKDFKSSFLDFRQIKNCVFNRITANATEYQYQFDVLFTEEYNVKAENDQDYGDSVKVTFTLKLMNNASEVIFYKNLKKDCQARNKQINTLTQTALQAGSDYYSLYFDYSNRQLTLDKQAKLIDNATDLIEKARSDSEKKANELSVNLTQQKTKLQETQQKLQKIAGNITSTEDATNDLSKELKEVQIHLTTDETVLTLIKQKASTTKQELDSAISTIFKQLSLKDKLADDKTKAEAATIANRVEYEQQVAAIKKSQDDLKAKFDTQVQLNKENKEKIISKINNTNTNIANKAETIEGLSALLTSQQSDIKIMKQAVDIIQTQINKLYTNINKKRTILSQLDQQKNDYEAEVKAKKDRALAIGEAAKKNLADLKQKEIDTVQLLTNLTAKEKKLQITQATTASTKLLAAHEAFDKALAAIVYQNSMASFRTVRAATRVLANQHAAELAMVVRSENTQIKNSFMRQAKQQKQYNRLAQLRQNQIKIIRMQRVKVQQKLKHRLRRHK